MMSGTYPRKRSFDSWIVTKLRRVRSAFVDRNDSRVHHVTGVFALFKILKINSDICRKHLVCLICVYILNIIFINLHTLYCNVLYRKQVLKSVVNEFK